MGMRPIRPVFAKGHENVQKVMETNHKILDGGIDLGTLDFTTGTNVNLPGHLDNFHGFFTTPNPAGTEFSVTHNLNRVPTGYMIVMQDAVGQVFSSETAWTTSKIFLKSNIVGMNCRIMIY